MEAVVVEETDWDYVNQKNAELEVLYKDLFRKQLFMDKKGI